MPKITCAKFIQLLTVLLFLCYGVTTKTGAVEKLDNSSIAGGVGASSCNDVDRSLTTARKLALAPAIAKQLKTSQVDVLQSFASGGWSIILVDSHDADEAFLFYSSDPLTSHYVSLWSGAAEVDEEQKIKDWAIKNAPSIPTKLANCFAWYVTLGRWKNSLIAPLGRSLNASRQPQTEGENPFSVTTNIASNRLHRAQPGRCTGHKGRLCGRIRGSPSAAPPLICRLFLNIP